MGAHQGKVKQAAEAARLRLAMELQPGLPTAPAAIDAVEPAGIALDHPRPQRTGIPTYMQKLYFELTGSPISSFEIMTLTHRTARMTHAGTHEHSAGRVAAAYPPNC